MQIAIIMFSRILQNVTVIKIRMHFVVVLYHLESICTKFKGNFIYVIVRISTGGYFRLMINTQIKVCWSIFICLIQDLLRRHTGERSTQSYFNAQNVSNYIIKWIIIYSTFHIFMIQIWKVVENSWNPNSYIYNALFHNFYLTLIWYFSMIFIRDE